MSTGMIVGFGVATIDNTLCAFWYNVVCREAVEWKGVQETDGEREAYTGTFRRATGV